MAEGARRLFSVFYKATDSVYEDFALITSQWSELQILHWGLGFQYMNFEVIQLFSPLRPHMNQISIVATSPVPIARTNVAIGMAPR